MNLHSFFLKLQPMSISNQGWEGEKLINFQDSTMQTQK